MAEESDDPREVAWHPRFAKEVVGHDSALENFRSAFRAGKPHHAWLLHGPKGIGKATFAYQIAGEVLSVASPFQTKRWIESKSHPDLFVLERQLNDSKPRKLRAEISVEDARKLSSFLSHTSSSGWRVAIIDAADDLNGAASNALLKLVEEPPSKALLFIVNHVPGRTLRTLKSRCMKLGFNSLGAIEIKRVIRVLASTTEISDKELLDSAELARGSPGLALSLARSEGAKSFLNWKDAGRVSPSNIVRVASSFGGRTATVDDYEIFVGLVSDWVAAEAKKRRNDNLALLHEELAKQMRITLAYNLDRRQAVQSMLLAIDQALMAA